MADQEYTPLTPQEFVPEPPEEPRPRSLALEAQDRAARKAGVAENEPADDKKAEKTEEKKVAAAKKAKAKKAKAKKDKAAEVKEEEEAKVELESPPAPQRTPPAANQWPTR